MQRSISTMFLLSTALLLCISFVAAFDSGAWQYVRDIPVTADGSTKLLLDTTLLAHANVDGSDLRIVAGSTDVPFKLYSSPAPTLPLHIDSVSASSTRQAYRSVTFGPEKMIDGDFSGTDGSYFQIDGTIEQQLSWVIADLGAPALATSATITIGTASFSEVQVEGSSDGSVWTMLRAKGKSNGELRFAPSNFRFIKFTFWHGGDLVIRELQLFGDQPGYAVFNGEKAKKYQLYYGNLYALMPRYDLTGISVSATMPVVRPGSERANPQYRSDADGDGMLNVQDNCPMASNKDQRDSDDDGLGDACDTCALAKNKDQSDIDGDHVGDVCDNCAYVANADQYDDNLNSIGFACDDNDADGVLNPKDNCLLGRNPLQDDTDRNGIGDVCEDKDADSVPTYKDNCPLNRNGDQSDKDRDGVGDVCDVCAAIANADQRDADSDGIGDACEDNDADNVANWQDNCPQAPNADQIDYDQDGLGDACDDCPNHHDPSQADKDLDGVGDVCDTQDNRFLENKVVVWGIMIGAILLIGGLAFFMYGKPPAKAV